MNWESESGNGIGSQIERNCWESGVGVVCKFKKFPKCVFWGNYFMECRNTLLSKISEINSNLKTHNDLALIETLLFGNNSFSQYDMKNFRCYYCIYSYI